MARQSHSNKGNIRITYWNIAIRETLLVPKKKKMMNFASFTIIRQTAHEELNLQTGSQWHEYICIWQRKLEDSEKTDDLIIKSHTRLRNWTLDTAVTLPWALQIFTTNLTLLTKLILKETKLTAKVTLLQRNKKNRNTSSFFHYKLNHIQKIRESNIIFNNTNYNSSLSLSSKSVEFFHPIHPAIPKIRGFCLLKIFTQVIIQNLSSW